MILAYLASKSIKVAFYLVFAFKFDKIVDSASKLFMIYLVFVFKVTISG